LSFLRSCGKEIAAYRDRMAMLSGRWNHNMQIRCVNSKLLHCVH